MKKIAFVFIGLILCSSAYAGFYKQTQNQFSGFPDYVGVNASADMSVVCSTGQTVISTGSGTWACSSINAVGVNWSNINGLSPIQQGGINWSSLSGTLSPQSINWSFVTFDVPNTRMGINSTTPITSLQVVNGALISSQTTKHTSMPVPTGGNLSVHGTAGSNVYVHNASNTVQTFPGIIFRRSRGTITVPTQAKADDPLFGLFGDGLESDYTYGTNSVAIRGLAAEDMTPTSKGGYLVFDTVAIGTQTRIERMRIGSDGNIGIGSTSPLRRLDVNEASGNCLRLIYNDSDGSPANYADFLVSASGDLTIVASGGDVSFGDENIASTGAVKGVHKAADGTNAVADGTYTTGIGGTTNGTITIKDGIITAVQQAVA